MTIGVVAIIVVFMLAFLVPLILEARAQYVNPTPKMNNEDKRFAQIDKKKTRNMYECIKQ